MISLKPFNVFCPKSSKILVFERTCVVMSVCGPNHHGEIQTLHKQTIKPPKLLLTRQKQMCRFSKYLWTTRKMLCLPHLHSLPLLVEIKIKIGILIQTEMSTR